MKWSNIETRSQSNAGVVGVLKTPVDSPEVPDLNLFLFNLTKEFAKQNTDFFEVTGDLPFYYSERSLQSLFAVAASKLDTTPFTERPIRRMGVHKSDTDHRGSLDLWILNEPSVYLVELKHGWARLDSNGLPAWIHKTWSTGYQQVLSLDPSIDSQRYEDGGVNRILLTTLGLWRVMNTKTVLPGIEEIVKSSQRLVAGLKPSPNWLSVWCLPPRIVESARSPEQRSRYTYPVVVLAALVWAEE